MYDLYNQVKDAGNLGWTDDSGDGIHEPLLDVSNIDVFAPALVPGSGGGETPTPTAPPTATPNPTPSVFRLSVVARTAGKNKFADLTWSGATSANVDVYRSGVRVITTPNDGAYTDKPPRTATSATYKVCEAGTGVCSNEVTVTW